MNTGTINIGNRQKGRVRATSILDCDPEEFAIKEAVVRMLGPEFQDQIRNTENPHGGGNVSRRVIKILTEIPLGQLHQKRFYDLPIPFRQEGLGF